MNFNLIIDKIKLQVGDTKNFISQIMAVSSELNLKFRLYKCQIWMQLVPHKDYNAKYPARSPIFKIEIQTIPSPAADLRCPHLHYYNTAALMGVHSDGYFRVKV